MNNHSTTSTLGTSSELRGAGSGSAWYSTGGFTPEQIIDGFRRGSWRYEAAHTFAGKPFPPRFYRTGGAQADGSVSSVGQLPFDETMELLKAHGYTVTLPEGRGYPTIEKSI